MENFAVEKDFLRTFAFHYETGEPMPDELIEKIIASQNFNVAMACLRQVSFGLLDMAYYTQQDKFEADIIPFEKKGMGKSHYWRTNRWNMYDNSVLSHYVGGICGRIL